MNIYALKGYKVTVTDTSLNRGYSHYKELARQYLQTGEIYTVEYTNVHNSCTLVALQEVAGEMFKSVSFEEVEPQVESDDWKHKDW